MKFGNLISIPNDYSHYGRILDASGDAHTVEEGDIPQGAEVGDQLAYKVEIWGNESGLAHDLKEE